jgi:predicted DNA-binding protein
MITLRLDPHLDQIVSNAAKHLGLTKSELVRRSLVEYIGKLDNQNAWEAGQDLFGRYASGKGNLSSKRKDFVKEKIEAKRNEKDTH